MIFQSTQPEWAATWSRDGGYKMIIISIHAARVGCDLLKNKINLITVMISIHAARVGCDNFRLISLLK